MMMMKFEAEMVKLEDRARALRNALRRRRNEEAAELADIVTQLIQTVRENGHV